MDENQTNCVDIVDDLPFKILYHLLQSKVHKNLENRKLLIDKLARLVRATEEPEDSWMIPFSYISSHL